MAKEINAKICKFLFARQFQFNDSNDDGDSPRAFSINVSGIFFPLLLCFEPGELLSLVPLTPLCSHFPSLPLPLFLLLSATGQAPSWKVAGRAERRMDFRKMEICKETCALSHSVGIIMRAPTLWRLKVSFAGYRGRQGRVGVYTLWGTVAERNLNCVEIANWLSESRSGHNL